MKGIQPVFFSIATALLLVGCSGKSSSSTQGTNTVNVATNGFGGYVKSLRQDQITADKTIDVTSINQAIQMFNVQEGRYPTNLQELVPNYMPEIPNVPNGYKIVYDDTSGTVKVVQQQQ